MTGARYRLAGYAMVAVAATGWGLWSLFFRPAEAISVVHPALQALIVFGAQGIVTLPAGLRGIAKARPKSAWVAVAYLGVGDALNAALFFAAMQKSSLAVAVLSHYLAPVFVALAAPRVLGETPRSGTERAEKRGAPRVPQNNGGGMLLFAELARQNRARVAASNDDQGPWHEFSGAPTSEPGARRG